MIESKSIIGSGEEMLLNFWDYGKDFIILFLNLSNSISLKKMQDQMLMFFLSRTGLRY